VIDAEVVTTAAAPGGISPPGLSPFVVDEELVVITLCVG
jgi:hypothetical protein